MTAYALTADDGNILDALFEIEPSAVILHSRGGAKGKNETNPDYSAVLRLILRRMADKGILISRALVDSSRVQGLPLPDRTILDEEDQGASPDELFRRMSARMQKVGRAEDTLSAKGNSSKRIRLQLQEGMPSPTIADALGAVPLKIDLKSQQRLPAVELGKVTAEHIWNAVQLLLSGTAKHGFGDSTGFYLIADDGTRLPPKAVFGMAATEALNFEVLPKHFSGGTNSACFRILKAAGYLILPKDTHAGNPAGFTVPGDEHWTEGQARLVTHVRRERGNGLAAAKKAQFRRLNGKLWCERCKMDPVASYGPEHGEACIEVHHRAIQVQHMKPGHRTRLEDLQCLCANCHRIVHRALKADPSSA